MFPFGYGLSYTDFEYSNLRIDPSRVAGNAEVRVSFDIKNTGKVKGAETAQLYIQDVESTVERPVKELKRFKKVILKPGEKKKISFTLDKSVMSYYDVSGKDWKAEVGVFKVLIGSSSRDIRLEGRFTLGE